MWRPDAQSAPDGEQEKGNISKEACLPTSSALYYPGTMDQKMSSKIAVGILDAKLAAYFTTERSTPSFKALAKGLEWLSQYVVRHPKELDNALVAKLIEIGIYSRSKRLCELSSLALCDMVGSKIDRASAAFPLFRDVIEFSDPQELPFARKDALYMAMNLIKGIQDNTGSDSIDKGFVKSVGRLLLEEPEGLLTSRADKLLLELEKKKALPIEPLVELLEETFTGDAVLTGHNFLSPGAVGLVKRIAPSCTDDQKTRLILAFIERELTPYFESPRTMCALPHKYQVPGRISDMFFSSSSFYPEEKEPLPKGVNPTKLSSIVDFRLRMLKSALRALRPFREESKKRIFFDMRSYAKAAFIAENEVASVAVKRIKLVLNPKRRHANAVITASKPKELPQRNAIVGKHL